MYISYTSKIDVSQMQLLTINPSQNSFRTQYKRRENNRKIREIP